ncbi:MAG: glycosyltransferase family protein [Aliiglaciecola sp.]
MKILYGVQGTGNGHIARARVMAKALSKRNDIEVDYVFSGRDPGGYFDMEVFGNYRTYQGLTFITQNGAINRWKTLRQANIKQLIKDILDLDVAKYDVLLNDFEPITAWAAKLKFLASISISHQAAFKHNVPKSGESLSDRLLMRTFAPCEVNLGVHWYHFGFPIMPPFIEESRNDANMGSKILVYLPFENLSEIKDMLDQFQHTQFECYHPEIDQERFTKNTHWRRLSKVNFRKSLFNCAGVIANGGFELSSECLQLGKKILIKPLKKQYEQSSNCATLTRMGRGSCMNELDVNLVQQWLPKEPPEPIQYPDNPDVFIDWLMKEDWLDTQPLCDELWRKTKFPTSVLTSLNDNFRTG